MSISIRTLRSRDVRAWVDLINTADQVDNLGRATTMAERQAMLASPFYRPEQVWLAWAGKQCVGYVDAYLPEGDRAITNGMVHPAFRSQGIGRRLLRTVLAAAPSFGKSALDIPVVPRIQDAASLLRNEGFTLERYWWEMTWAGRAPPAIPAWPDGTRVRTFIPGQDETTWVQVDHAIFANAWGAWPHTLAEVRAIVRRPDFNPSHLLFAMAGDEVAGQCQAIPSPATSHKVRSGRIEDIGVIPAQRGRGLGRALLRQGMCSLYDQGCRLIELTVDGDNASARRLYESEGFTVTSQLHWYRKVVGRR